MSCWLFFCGAIGKPRHPGIVRCRPTSGSRLHFCEQARRHVPVLPGIGDHRDGLLVVARQDSHQLRLPVRVEFHAFSDAEIQHRAVRAHLFQDSQPSHHLVIQLDEFGFRKRINIKVRHGRFSSDQDSHILTENQGPAPLLKLMQCAQPSEWEEALLSLDFADQIHSPTSSAGNAAARLTLCLEKDSLAPKFFHSCSPERGCRCFFSLFFGSRFCCPPSSCSSPAQSCTWCFRTINPTIASSPTKTSCSPLCVPPVYRKGFIFSRIARTRR